jgi:hypothetical protein
MKVSLAPAGLCCPAPFLLTLLTFLHRTFIPFPLKQSHLLTRRSSSIADARWMDAVSLEASSPSLDNWNDLDLPGPKLKA